MRAGAWLAALWLVGGAPLAGQAVEIYRAAGGEAFLAGEARGLAVRPDGGLSLAPEVERLAVLEEAVLLAGARHPEGWVLGTGDDGRVILVDESGHASVLFEAPEPEVFAVWADPDGTVFAGTSPHGKVYRIAGGRHEVYFEPGELYVWSLRRGADGALLAATGDAGRLYRITGRGEGEVLYESRQPHLRSLLGSSAHGVVVGTAGAARLIAVAPDGTARTLHHAGSGEVVAIEPGPDGVLYAAVGRGEPRAPGALPSVTAGGGQAPDPATGAAEGSTPATGSGAPGSLSVGTAPSLPLSAPAGAAQPRAELLALQPDGRVESLWSSRDETVYALAWHRDRLWLGTGLDGRLYSLENGRVSLEEELDERQIVLLLPRGGELSFGTANTPSLYRVGDRLGSRGTYLSDPLDAGGIATFGRFAWRGESPAGTGIAFAFRTGGSPEPDETWLPWSEARPGREIDLTGLPAGRYLQWRADVHGPGGASARLEGVEVSYRQANRTPRIRSFTVSEPGEVLVSASFNPADQVFEPAHPNREGIFTTLEPAAARPSGLLKSLWKRGYRSMQWETEDPNGDRLLHDLSFRRHGGDGPWREIATDLEESHYNFDATVLPDGLYRFRLVATDRAVQRPPRALEAWAETPPVVVDHTPPELAEVRPTAAGLEVRVADRLSPVVEAEVSVNGGPWRPAPVADGHLDGPSETLRLAPGPDAELLLLRLRDAAHNTVTLDLGGHLP